MALEQERKALGEFRDDPANARYAKLSDKDVLGFLRRKGVVASNEWDQASWLRKRHAGLDYYLDKTGAALQNTINPRGVEAGFVQDVAGRIAGSAPRMLKQVALQSAARLPVGKIARVASLVGSSAEAGLSDYNRTNDAGSAVASGLNVAAGVGASVLAKNALVRQATSSGGKMLARMAGDIGGSLAADVALTPFQQGSEPGKTQFQEIFGDARSIATWMGANGLWAIPGLAEGHIEAQNLAADAVRAKQQKAVVGPKYELPTLAPSAEVQKAQADVATWDAANRAQVQWSRDRLHEQGLFDQKAVLAAMKEKDAVFIPANLESQYTFADKKKQIYQTIQGTLLHSKDVDPKIWLADHGLLPELRPIEQLPGKVAVPVADALPTASELPNVADLGLVLPKFSGALSQRNFKINPKKATDLLYKNVDALATADRTGVLYPEPGHTFDADEPSIVQALENHGINLPFDVRKRLAGYINFLVTPLTKVTLVKGSSVRDSRILGHGVTDRAVVYEKGQKARSQLDILRTLVHELTHSGDQYNSLSKAEATIPEATKKAILSRLTTEYRSDYGATKQGEFFPILFDSIFSDAAKMNIVEDLRGVDLSSPRRLLEAAQELIELSGDKVSPGFARVIEAFIKVDNQNVIEALQLSKVLSALPDAATFTRPELADTSGTHLELQPTGRIPIRGTPKEPGHIAKMWDKYFLDPLSRTRYMPFLREAWNKLNTFDWNVKNENGKAYEMFGRFGEGQTQTQRIQQAGKWIARWSTDWSAPIKKAMMAAQDKLRPMALEEAKSFTVEELQSKFGMDKEQAAFTRNIFDAVKQSAENTILKQKQIDEVSLARLLFADNLNQDPNQLLAAVQKLFTGIDNVAAIQHQIGQLKGILKARESTLLPTDQIRQQIEQKIMMSEQQLAGIMKPYADALLKVTSPERAQMLLDLAVAQSKSRLNMMRQLQRPDYLPMTRRGRFILHIADADGQIQETTGHKTESDALKYMKEHNIPEEWTRLYDMERERDRVRFYSFDSMKSLRSEVSAEIKRAFDSLLQSARSPEEQTMVKDIYAKLQSEYSPLQSLIEAEIATTDLKYKEKRNYVAGFDERDFLPNAFEYISKKNRAAEKAYTNAFVSFQYDQNAVNFVSGLRHRLEQERAYLFTPTNEWRTLRNIAYNSYLGGSIKNAILGTTQLFYTGATEYIAQGGNATKAPVAFAQAAMRHRKWMRKGDIGDDQMNRLFKTFSSDSAAYPTAIEGMMPTSDETITALERGASAAAAGNLGAKASEKASGLWRGTQNFLRLGLFATEQYNRGISFLAGAELAKQKGLKTDADIYKFAVNFTNTANLVGSKANRVGLLTTAAPDSVQHAVTSSMMGLQTFMFGQLNQLVSIARTAKMHHNSQQWKALVYGVAAVLSTSGAMGLSPGGRSLDNALGEIFGEKPSEKFTAALRGWSSELFGADEEMGGKFADAILLGVPAAFGVDLGQSVGIGDPLLTYRGGERNSPMDLLGPSGGIMQQAWNGLSEIIHDPSNPEAYLRAGKLAQPKILDQIRQANNALLFNRVQSRSGQMLAENLSLGETIASLLGFTPTSVTKRYGALDLERRTGDKDTRERRSSTADVTKSLQDYEASRDIEYLKQARKQARSYLSQHPTVKTADYLTSLRNTYLQHKTSARVLPQRGRLRERMDRSSDVYGNTGGVMSPSQALRIRERLARMLGSAKR